MAIRNPRWKPAVQTAYRVTVHTADYPDFTVDVWGTTTGKAKAAAMAGYPYRLNGQFVSYAVEAIDSAPVRQAMSTGYICHACDQAFLRLAVDADHDCVANDKVKTS